MGWHYVYFNGEKVQKNLKYASKRLSQPPLCYRYVHVFKLCNIGRLVIEHSLP